MNVAIAAAVLLAAAPAAAASGRYALVLGNNEGGPGRARLWFAERDAERFARGLVELGSFTDDAVEVLKGASLGDVRAATARLEKRIARDRAAGSQALLVLYFSGHASAAGLELRSERLGFDELRDMMTRSAADARVAIVDACESGALTQVKGARVAPQLEFALPMTPAVTGVAYIASTAVGESAQESAALGGSFFSVNLDAAMRGAADADGDGRVTLAEAFRYTSSMTVAGTAETASGPQHPTFDIRMAGRGDVVLTELRRAEARLALPGDATQRFVLTSDRGVVTEAPGGATLALAAGHYVVERRRAGVREVAEVDLDRGELRALPALRDAPALVARAKGGARRDFDVFAGGTLGSALMRGQSAAPGFRAGVEQRLGATSLRLHFDYRASAGLDRTLSYRLQSMGGRFGALLPLFDGAVRLRGGVEAGFEWNTQSVAGTSLSTGALVLGPTAIASVALGAFEVGLQFGVPLHFVRIDDKAGVHPRVEGAVLFGYSP